MIAAETLWLWLADRFQLAEHADYSTALNGLQVEGPKEIRRIAVSVDVSEEVISAAVEANADLLIVHHGLFWGGLQPLTGRHFRKVRRLVEARLALWACHLPLDGDLELGNGALLARAVGVESLESFGDYKGWPIGVAGVWRGARSDLVAGAAKVLGGPVQVIDGGPERVERVAVITGSGSSFLPAMVESGIDTLLTGEGNHHTYVDAHELGVNILYGGHYRTEVFGVRALAEELSRTFDLDWTFLDFPSGL